jgi:hypothetical protein
MKLLTSILLTALLSFVAGLYLPWWSMALMAFLVAIVIRQRPVRSWLGGFAGLFILWGLLAFWIDVKNQGVLSARIATLIPLGGSALALIFVTALVGAIVAGFAALSASYLHRKQV